MNPGIPASALQNLIELVTPPEEIKWRSGQRAHAGDCGHPCTLPHKQLAYIDARYVMRVLDTLVGPASWQTDLRPGTGGITLCGIGIKVDGEWIWKWDGAGETDIEGEKGSVSDAFKRAAVRWGIARDLYAIQPQSQAPSAPQRAQAPSSPAPQSDSLIAGLDDAPACPYHHSPATRSKFPDRVTGIVGWYCREKAGNGSPENTKGYCGWKA